MVLYDEIGQNIFIYAMFSGTNLQFPIDFP